jgi:chromosome segregation ATPase
MSQQPDPKDEEIKQLRSQLIYKTALLDARAESIEKLGRQLEKSENKADALSNALNMMTVEHGKAVQAHAETETKRRQTFNALTSYMKTVHELSDKLAAAQQELARAREARDDALAFSVAGWN